MTELPDDAALTRLLEAWEVPALPSDFAARTTAQAIRGDRPRLPPRVPPRGRTRPWTRRGVWTGIIAINIALASAVAAAFGGGGFDLHRLHIAAVHLIARVLPHHRPAAPRPASHPPVRRQVAPATRPLPPMPPPAFRSPPTAHPVIRRPAMRPTFHALPRRRRPEYPFSAHGGAFRRPDLSRHPQPRFGRRDDGVDRPRPWRQHERGLDAGWHASRSTADEAAPWRGGRAGWRDRPPTFERPIPPRARSWRGGRAGRFGQRRWPRGRF